MQKKAIFIVAVSVVIVIAIFLGYKIAVSGKKQAPASESIPSKIETASKEEAQVFAFAYKCETSGDLLTARDAYQKIIEKFPNSDNIQRAQEGLERTNINILFSPTPTPDSSFYEVQKGDTLSKIARKFSTTQELILKANNLKSENVVPLGRRLKVRKDKFSIVVDKSQNILTLKSRDHIVKTYHVSTGLNNSTPVGAFKIVNKIINPPWYTAGGVIPPDSPKNILGSRWLGISVPGYGIHGTTQPQSIGKQVTSGCVRMKNSDVEELYAIVPEGTEVVIVD